MFALDRYVLVMRCELFNFFLFVHFHCCHVPCVGLDAIVWSICLAPKRLFVYIHCCSVPCVGLDAIVLVHIRDTKKSRCLRYIHWCSVPCVGGLDVDVWSICLEPKSLFVYIHCCSVPCVGGLHANVWSICLEPNRKWRLLPSVNAFVLKANCSSHTFM